MVDKSISPLQTNFGLDLLFEESSEAIFALFGSECKLLGSLDFSVPICFTKNNTEKRRRIWEGISQRAAIGCMSS